MRDMTECQCYRKTSSIRSAVLTQSTSVTDRQTDGRINRLSWHIHATHRALWLPTWMPIL